MEESEQLLEQLHDIELPGNSGLPIAPGWLVLALLLCLAAGFLWRRRKGRKLPVVTPDWQTPARLELAEIDSRLQRGDTTAVLSDCSRLARRITLARVERTEVAGLTGRQWLQKLDDLSASDFFTRGRGQLLATAPYQKDTITDVAQLQQVIDAVQRLVDQKGVTTA